MNNNIQLIIFIIFVVNATLACNFSIRFCIEDKPKIKTNYMVMCILISSFIWSVGMGLMSIQSDDRYAYLWRTIGIFGTFMFMMSVQKFMCYLSGINHKIQVLLNGISYSGLFIYFLYIRPGQTIFVHSVIGTTFYFKPGLINDLYALYFMMVSTNIFLVTLYAAKNNKRQRVRVGAKRFIIVESLIYFGAIFDMFVPVFGKTAFPGSAITHFWGVFIFWFAVHGMYNSQITISNMSEYIYYSLDIPVMVFNADKKLQIINDAASSFLFTSNQSLVEKETEIGNYFDIGNEIFEFQEKSHFSNAICINNSAPCQLAISKIQDEYRDIIGYILIVNDLSEHNLVIKKLEQAKLEADAANMSKSLFLANMSHEIRTPMNAILGFADLALDDSIDEKSKEYISDMKQSGETLLGIINDILNISKIELGKQELTCSNYDSGKIFQDVSIIINMQASKKNLKFETNIAEDFPKELYGDKDKIREILINILNNSVKYTKEGKITFEANVLSKEGDVADIQFKVRDTGIGIKAEDIDKIFDKFQRVDAMINKQTEGTGLGLSITKGLIEMMDGIIEVESVYGLGSLFTITIPQKIVDASPIAYEHTQEIAAIKKELRFRDVKFLAVDDNKVNLKVISKTMARYGIEYDLAASGEEAIEQCRNNSYDVILMDQMMPVMDGVEAMTNIRQLEGYEKGKSAKIIALTANVIDGVKEELLEKGFDNFLGKPINFAEFEKVLCEELPAEKYN